MSSGVVSSGTDAGAGLGSPALPPATRLPAAQSHRAHGAWITISLVALPALLILAKSSALPGTEFLLRWLSFQGLTEELQGRAYHLLITPVGVLVVVVFRLTLGIRVLGPFRSVLLAMAFQVTGAVVGLLFFAVVLGAVWFIRPAIKRMKLPYFGRSGALLAAVAAVIVLAMLAGLALGLPSIERVAYFPIVVLTMTGEAFVSTVRREGPRSAAWRTSWTAAVALLIAALSSVPALRSTLLHFPELVLVCTAGIVLVCRRFKLRLLQRLNPVPIKPRKKKPKAAAPIVA